MQMRVLRRIEGVSRLDRVRNVDLRGRLKQEGVLDTVKKRQQNWKQRVEEMSTNRVTKKIYDGEIPGRRPEEDPGRNGAVTLINSTLSNMQSFIKS